MSMKRCHATTTNPPNPPDRIMSRAALRKVVVAGQDVSKEFATMLTSASLAWSDAVKAPFDKLGAFKNVVTYAITALTSGFVKEQCTKLCADTTAKK